MSRLAEPAAPTRPLRADARRNREAVVAAARAVFAEQGREAQMDDVARRAKVGVGTVYRHFPTKEALIEALAVDSFARLTAIAREALDATDPWEAFVDVLWRGGEIMAGDRALTEVVMATPGAMEAGAGASAEMVAVVEQLVRRAQDAGRLRPDVITDDIGMLMCGLGSATRKAHACPGSWRRHLAILIDGLRADAATSSLSR
jgi:AcrR family transcriptional regulator